MSTAAAGGGGGGGFGRRGALVRLVVVDDWFETGQIFDWHLGGRQVGALVFAFVQQVAPFVQYGLLLVVLVLLANELGQVAVADQILIQVRMQRAALVRVDERAGHARKSTVQRVQVTSVHIRLVGCKLFA